MELLYYFAGLITLLGATMYFSELIYKAWTKKKEPKEFDYDEFNKENFGI